MLYTRPQLRLLVALAAALLVGLGVAHWRARFAELADRLESFDRDEPAATGIVADLDPAASAAPGRAAAPPPEPARPLDLNRATAEDLARLPGIGPALAARIVAERQRRGGFGEPGALRGILGLGPRKLAALEGLVVASGPEARRRDAAPPTAARTGAAPDIPAVDEADGVAEDGSAR